MLNEAELSDWFQRLAIPVHGRAAIHQVRSSDPARRVGGGRLNVSGRYPSRKTGDAIFVEGRLQVRTFESRTGQQTAVEIIPSVVRFLGSAAGSPRVDRDLRTAPGQPRAKVNGHGSQAAAADESDTDELPF